MRESCPGRQVWYQVNLMCVCVTRECCNSWFLSMGWIDLIRVSYCLQWLFVGAFAEGILYCKKTCMQVKS